MIYEIWQLLRRQAIPLIVSALIGLFTAAFWPPERTNRWLEPIFLALHQIEWRGYDLMFHWRGAAPEAVDERVVIVGFDRDTELALEDGKQHPWPPPRRFHGQVLERLAADGAKVVVFDILLSTPSGHGLADDKALDAALAHAKCPVILACRVNRDAATMRKSLEAPYYNDQTGIDFERNARSAFTEILRDRADDVVRSTLPLQRFQDEWLPSLAAAALLASGKREIKESHLTSDRIFVGPYPIPRTGPTSVDPTDPTNILATTYLDFPGGNATFPIVRYEQVARGEFVPGTFRNKIVFVGVTGTELAKATGDVYRTAYSRLTPERAGGQDSSDVFGVVVQAQTFNALAQRTIIEQSGGFAAGMVTFVLALVAALGVRTFMNWRGPALVVGALMLYFAMAYSSFTYLRIYLPWLVPSMAMVVVVGLIAFTDRAHLKQRWGRYVSPAYLEIMLREGFEAKPERTTATVLFGDIRGFTAFSERHTPEKVVELLDKHLDKMVHIVFEEGGTVDKFLGDGILVVFGAPRFSVQERSAEDLAQAAIRAAWRMRQASMEPVIDAQGQPFLFATGFGVTTGPLVCGHVGGRNLTSLTLIGDPVNLASRLQGLTGEPDILIDESTRTLASDTVTVEELGLKQIKGKGEGVLCFKVTDVTLLPPRR